MATLATVLSFARAQSQSDSNGLTDAKGIIFANEALFDFRRNLISSGVDASQTQEAYRDSTVGTGTYLYPTDMFFLKAIELNYTNANAQDYKPASQVDVSNLQPGVSFSWLRTNASQNSPQFDDRGDQYEIFPTPVTGNNVTNAIRIFYFLQPTEFTATSDTITYPETLDYRLLGWRIASSYYYSMNKFDEGDKINSKYAERVKQLIGTLSRGVQTPLQAQGLGMDGWNF